MGSDEGTNVDVAANLRGVEDRVGQAAGRVGRSREEITIVGVTKGLGVERALQGIRAGLKHLGENYVQEAVEKQQGLEGQPVTWHFIGHLQTNKVKQAIRMFEWVHSVDSVRLAEEISRRFTQEAGEDGSRERREMKVLLEVNTSGEGSKFGAEPAEAAGVAERIGVLPGLRLLGLMTIGPLAGDAEEARPCFRRVRELAGEIEARQLPGVEMRHLSMGMTNDFEVAIEEGATIIRVGTAIFGPRPSRTE